MELIDISRELAREVDALSFALPVTYVYNPLVYARQPHEEYLRRYGAKPKEVILLGMNPGPFGMAQTGIPFGDVTMVRDWLGITGMVEHPTQEHPRRPVDGFACLRHEVSGTRLWGWASSRFASPEHFFTRFFVVNYCPLVFMEESGKNHTPDKLSVAERTLLYGACDRALRRIVAHLQPSHVIGIGDFATKRLREALLGQEIHIGTVLHPSPASPMANRGWAAQAEKQLIQLGITLQG